ncbi:TPA: methyltransferase, partial [Pseudomonas aeruginosa]|nr:methyltransferase [Pseudomonas aeruginosa]
TGGGTGGGDGSGEGGGTGGGTGLEGGCKDDSCAFVKNNPFGTDKVPGFDESLQKAWTDIKKAPIGQALGKITFPTGGSCPVQSVELFGKSVMFDSHCNLWSQIEPILKAVFLAFWALLSVRVFLSA